MRRRRAGGAEAGGFSASPAVVERPAEPKKLKLFALHAQEDAVVVASLLVAFKPAFASASVEFVRWPGDWYGADGVLYFVSPDLSGDGYETIERARACKKKMLGIYLRPVSFDDGDGELVGVARNPDPVAQTVDLPALVEDLAYALRIWAVAEGVPVTPFPQAARRDRKPTQPAAVPAKVEDGPPDPEDCAKLTPRQQQDFEAAKAKINAALTAYRLWVGGVEVRADDAWQGKVEDALLIYYAAKWTVVKRNSYKYDTWVFRPRQVAQPAAESNPYGRGEDDGDQNKDNYRGG